VLTEQRFGAVPFCTNFGDDWERPEPDDRVVRFLNQQGLVKCQTELVGNIDRCAASRRRTLKSGCPRPLFHLASLTRRACQAVIPA
jgi:hypothetical protein